MDGNYFMDSEELLKEIYELGQVALERDKDAVRFGCDLILDTLDGWMENEEYEKLDNFFIQADLRKIHHEFVEMIDIATSTLNTKNKRNFMKKGKVVLKAIDNFVKDNHVEIKVNHVV